MIAPQIAHLPEMEHVQAILHLPWLFSSSYNIQTLRASLAMSSVGNVRSSPFELTDLR